MRQVEQFACHDALKAIDFGDAVAGLNYGADFGDFNAGAVAFNLLADDLADFVCSDGFHYDLRSGAEDQGLEARD